MGIIDPNVLAAGAAIAGVVSHLAWFIRGEHDLYARQYLVLWSGAQAAAYFTLTRIAEQSPLSACASMTIVSSAYLGALFSSIVIYRLFFHKLRHFPGPLSWRLTKLTQVVANSDSFGYKHLDDLHQRYGRFVRTGPNDISINDPIALQTVLGPGSKCIKHIWYDIAKPLVSLHQCRDKKIHDLRRRSWDKGFNAKSLRDYSSRVSSYTDSLMKQMRAFGGGALNASKWFNYYSFDVMGDLAFGESFHMLDTGEKHFAIPLLEAGQSILNVVPAAPWVFSIMMKIPFISADYHKFLKWSGEQAEKRRALKVSEPDVVHHLLDAPPMSADPFINKQWMVGDARLIIVAGSDTTAATLTYAAYELIKDQKSLKTLRDEVKPLLENGQFDYMELQKCEHLNAVIDEALRLHPPVPSGLLRVAPPEGIKIGDTYLPGGTVMQLPLYTLQRSPEAFERPNEFIPERWYSQPQMIKMKNASAPFSMGPYGCIGKSLAYMELRNVLAKLVTEFDIDFAPQEDGSNLIDKTEDHFTLNLADMFITCTPRNA